jgi:hypothetical protein
LGWKAIEGHPSTIVHEREFTPVRAVTSRVMDEGTTTPCSPFEHNSINTPKMEVSRHPIEGRITELLSVAMPLSSSKTIWIQMDYKVDCNVRFFCFAARG